MKRNHHKVHLVAGFIQDFAEQLKAAANSTLLDSVPSTLWWRRQKIMTLLLFPKPLLPKPSCRWYWWCGRRGERMK